MWLIILTMGFVLAVHFLVIKPRSYWSKKGAPSLMPLPLVGNLGRRIFRKVAAATLMQEWYSHFPNKRYFGLHQMLSPVLMLRDPELIKKITIKEFNSFPEHGTYVDEEVDPLWGKNMFALKGEKWHKMRSTLSPFFTSSKMRVMYGLLKQCVQQFTSHFEKQGDLITLEMKDAYTKFTNDVIATTAFGVTCDSLRDPNNEFYIMGKDATDFSGFKSLRFVLSAISPALMKIGIFSERASTFFRGLIKEAIRVREEKGVIRPDMIHLLLEARKGRLKQEEIGVPDSGFAVVQEHEVGLNYERQKAEISDDDITAQAMIFFLAGFDMVSTLMCFTTYELAVNPEIQERLFLEITEAYQSNNGEMTYEILLGMKYLDMVITESLRKWPPVTAMDRVAARPFTIEPELPDEKPVHLEVGTTIWIPAFALHRDPNYYPNPDRFDPERFSESNKHNIKPFTFIPFGTGPRNCIGSRFALLECKLIIAETLRKFEIIPVDKTPIPLVLSPSNMMAVPDEGFWLGFKRRSVTC